MEGSTSIKSGGVEQGAHDHDARLVGGPGGGTPNGEIEPGREAVERAADSVTAAKQMSEPEKMDALTWLLTDDSEEEETVTQKWQFNVGTEDSPVWIYWTIKPIDSDMMSALREQSRGPNRQARRAARGETDIDITLFNQRMVAAATVEPDLQEAARRKGVEAADPLYGPVELLKRRFRGKPGIVDQIAGKVMLLSGYDEDDVIRATPETTMVRAAGNS